jgi:predicted nucleic acid-binding protein
LGTDARDRLTADVSAFGRVAFDTNACIFFLRRTEPLDALVRAILDLVVAGRITVEISGIAQCEMLVPAYRYDDRALRLAVLSLTERTPGIELAPVTRDVLFAAAHLRSTKQYKLPDALVIATAAVGHCGAIVGSDEQFRALNLMEGLLLGGGPGKQYAIPRFISLREYAAVESE